jgi:2',3'-cyclic-nucleotide 2'-phosphodiesterase (5'-nucleotidase family)
MIRLTPLLSLLLCGHAAAARITIVHTNDIHGWIMARPAKDDPKRLVGGAAALAALYKEQPGPKLLLDGGDWFQGTPEGSLSQGQVSVELFNAIPYDAVVVGNHDFDNTEARLKALVAQLKMPVLGANVYDEKTHKRVGYLKPWIIKNIGGAKVGIFGLLTTNMRNLTFPENFAGLEFRDEIAEARDDVAALKKEGATVIILLDHVGFEEPTMSKFVGDQTIAREVPGIDLIVGGHSHTFLRKPYVDEKNGTLVVQDGSYLVTAGVVTLNVDDKTGRVVSKDGRLMDLDVAEGEDPVIAAIVAKETAKVSAVYDVVIATSETSLTRARDSEASMGDWMTDCERDWAGSADLSVQNAGGIRADLPQGPITLRNIFNLMPFDNYLVRLDMDGGLVRDMLDHGVDKTKGMIQESGATFTYDRTAEAGHRITDVQVGGKPLDPKALYKIVTIDFLVKGGDGYTPFARAEKSESTRVLLRDALAQCARKQHLISKPAGGRMRAQETAK